MDVFNLVSRKFVNYKGIRKYSLLLLMMMMMMIKQKNDFCKNIDQQMCV